MADRSGIETGAFGRVTVRAVVLGLITVAWMCVHADYEAHVSGTSILTLSNFPMAALIAFVLWVIINSVWRAISIRTALRPMEMLTIMIMSWAAGMMPARGWAGRLVGLMGAIQPFATVENRWAKIFDGGDTILTSTGLLPTWAFPSTTTQAGWWFYMGLPEGGTKIPWDVLMVPYLWWGTAAVAMIAVAISISVIFHRQWASYERLTFPLASMPMTLVSVRGHDRVPTVFKTRAFWIGVVLSGGVLMWNIGHYFVPSWPRIGIYDPAYNIRQEILTGFPYVSFRIYPPVIGFLYLANLDLLLSLWVFWFFGWLETGIVDTLGIAVGETGTKLTGTQLVQTHNYGALVFLAIWSIWVARKHLAAVWRMAWSRDRAADNSDGVLSYRTSLVMFVLGLGYLGFFGTRLGMTLNVLIPALLLVLVAFFVAAKYMAATGMPYVNPPGFGNGQLLTNIAGSNWMSPQAAAGLGLFHSGAFGAESRLFGLGMMPHTLKVGDYSGTAGGRRSLLGAVVLALAVGAAVSIWHTTWLGYNRAGLRMDNFTIRSNPESEITRIAKSVETIQLGKALPFDTQKFGAWGIGFGLAGLLSVLHARTGWWPLHPVGFAFSGGSAGTYWLSIFLVWASKLLILRLGGVRLYDRAKPLFIGLIVGYVFGLICSYSVDAVFFPGGGHGIEDW